MTFYFQKVTFWNSSIKLHFMMHKSVFIGRVQGKKFAPPLRLKTTVRDIDSLH